MLKTVKMFGLFSATIILSGCLATTGGKSEGQSDANMMDSAVDTVGSVASSLGEATSSLFGGGESGSKVTDEKLEKLIKGKSTEANVVEILGYPNSKSTLKNKELWHYVYQKQGLIQREVQIFIVELNDKGILVDAYETSDSGKSNFFF